MQQHHPRVSLAVVLTLAACALFPACAAHRAPPPRDVAPMPAAVRSIVPKEGERTGLVGVGATFDPDAVSLSGSADFYQTERFAIGPDLLLAFDEDADIISTTFHGKFVFPIGESTSTLLMPYVKAGGGFASIELDNGASEFGFEVFAGGGLEVRFDEHYGLSSELLAHLLPQELVDEDAYVSWQIVQFTFHF